MRRKAQVRHDDGENLAIASKAKRNAHAEALSITDGQLTMA
jgi:hypothetical protein